MLNVILYYYGMESLSEIMFSLAPELILMSQLEVDCFQSTGDDMSLLCHTKHI